MRRSIGFGILAFAVLVCIGVYLVPLEPNILHLQFAFSEESFSAVLSKWQSSGIARYRSHFPADFFLLGAYGAFGWLLGRERAPSLAVRPRLTACLTWALPVAAVADATENVLHLVLTGANAPTSATVYLLSGSAASIKWLGIAVFGYCAVLNMRKRPG